MSTAALATTQRTGRPFRDRVLALAIGFRIRSQRTALGLTQTQLGDTLGIARLGVCHWEAGRRIPDPARLVPLCRALGITPNDLFGWEADR